MSGAAAGAGVRHALLLEPGESRALALAFGYFFLLLCGYYVLRPLRDEMGIAGGVDQLQWVFSGTFVVMLLAVPAFGKASALFARARLVPVVYGFFVLNILVFYLLFRTLDSPVVVARAFFIWTSVFNLFVVSVFWSFMTDVFSVEQARRMFGIIAAGGSAGAICGPLLTASLVGLLGPVNLLLLAAALLGATLPCVLGLSASAARSTRSPPAERTGAALGGSALGGPAAVLRSRYLLGICLFMLLFTTLATFLYFAQANLIAGAFDDPAARTRLFALLDLAVNVSTILLQAFVTSRLVRRFGVTSVLMLVPVLLLCGFAGLAVAPLLAVLLSLQVARRAGNYALTRPVREMLFTAVDRESRYKAKNFIDTVVYRGGDALSAWVFAGLKAFGFGLSGIALIALPLAALWALSGWLLGRRYTSLTRPVAEKDAL